MRYSRYSLHFTIFQRLMAEVMLRSSFLWEEPVSEHEMHRSMGQS